MLFYRSPCGPSQPTIWTLQNCGKQMLLLHSRLHFRSGGRHENEWRKERNLRDECVFPWLWALFHLMMRTKSPEKKDLFRSVCSPGSWTGHSLFMSWYVERRNIAVFCCRMLGFVYSHIVFFWKLTEINMLPSIWQGPSIKRRAKIFSRHSKMNVRKEVALLSPSPYFSYYFLQRLQCPTVIACVWQATSAVSMPSSIYLRNVQKH